jgi:hypothetical protein
MIHSEEPVRSIGFPKLRHATSLPMRYVQIIKILWGSAIFVAACQASSQPATVDMIPTGTISLPETSLPETQGYLIFPYVSADAGNFSLQAGEEILITWEDAPMNAAQYEIRFIDNTGSADQTFKESVNSAEGIHAVWHVPERASGQLEGVAVYPDGSIVRAHCCTQIYSGELPPEGKCILSLSSLGIQNIDEQPTVDSLRIAGLAPGKYVEVITRTTEEWYFVKAEHVIDLAKADTVFTEGWMKGTDNVDLHRPCEDIPFLDG